MKNYYLDVTVIEKRRIRVDFNSAKKPTKASVLEMLKKQKYHDITDEEHFEYLEVLELKGDM